MECTQLIDDVIIEEEEDNLSTQQNYYIEYGTSSFQLKCGINKIGRDSSQCDIVIDHKSISRLHAVIDVAVDGVTVHDEGSSNRSWKNAKLLRPQIRHSLEGDECLTFGDVKLYFRIGSIPPPSMNENVVLIPETPVSKPVPRFPNSPMMHFIPESQSSPMIRPTTKEESLCIVEESLNDSISFLAPTQPPPTTTTTTTTTKIRKQSLPSSPGLLNAPTQRLISTVQDTMNDVTQNLLAEEEMISEDLAEEEMIPEDLAEKRQDSINIEKEDLDKGHFVSTQAIDEFQSEEKTRNDKDEDDDWYFIRTQTDAPKSVDETSDSNESETMLNNDVIIETPELVSESDNNNIIHKEGELEEDGVIDESDCSDIATQLVQQDDETFHFNVVVKASAADDNHDNSVNRTNKNSQITERLESEISDTDSEPILLSTQKLLDGMASPIKDDKVAASDTGYLSEDESFNVVKRRLRSSANGNDSLKGRKKVRKSINDSLQRVIQPDEEDLKLLEQDIREKDDKSVTPGQKSINGGKSLTKDEHNKTGKEEEEEKVESKSDSIQSDKENISKQDREEDNKKSMDKSLRENKRSRDKKRSRSSSNGYESKIKGKSETVIQPKLSEQDKSIDKVNTKLKSSITGNNSVNRFEEGSNNDETGIDNDSGQRISPERLIDVTPSDNVVEDVNVHNNVRETKRKSRLKTTRSSTIHHDEDDSDPRKKLPRQSIIENTEKSTKSRKSEDVNGETKVRRSKRHTIIKQEEQEEEEEEGKDVFKVPESINSKRSTRRSSKIKTNSPKRKGCLDEDCHSKIAKLDKFNDIKTEVKKENGVRKSRRMTEKGKESVELNESFRSRSISRGRLKEKPIVMFTGYDDIQQDVKIVEDLGGTVSTQYNECTVLVTDKLRRTLKLVCMMGKGVPVVSPNYLSQCKEVRYFLDPWKYVIVDPEFERKYSFVLKTSLLIALKEKLLNGYKVHITKSVNPPPDQFKDVIECSGGKFLKSIRGNLDPKCVVVSCPEDKSVYSKFLKKGYLVVSKEFLLTGILKQDLDFKTYCLK